MTLRTSADPVATRETWHRVAEHVLAAGQFAAAGTIRLRPVPGGLGTTVGIDGRQLTVTADGITVLEAGRRRSAPLTTLRQVAAFAGVQPGLRGSYPPATPLDLDAPLPVDATAAERLARWYALGDTALRRFAAGLGAPADPVLWPEHLDLAVTVDAVGYGVSPGDDAVPAPYLYVGPHEDAPSADDFWNAPFGAALTADRVPTVDAAVAFFEHGRALTGRSRS
jgi:hypothetical protein